MRIDPGVRERRIGYILADLFSITLSYFLFNSVRYVLEDQNQTYGEYWHYLFSIKAFWVGLVFIAFWMGLFAISGYYNKPIGKSRLLELSTTFISVLVGAIVVFLALVVDDIVKDTKLYLKLFTILFVIAFTFVYTFRLLWTNRGIRLGKRGYYADRVLLVGSGKTLVDIRKHLEETQTKIVGEVELTLLGPNSAANEAISKALPAIAEAINEKNPRVVVVAIDGIHAETMTHLLYKLYPYKVRIKVPTRSLIFAGAKLRVASMHGEPMVDVTDVAMSECEKNIKWLFDKLSSALLLILFSPIFAYVAWRVKRSSPGPIFYGQERIGLHGRPFTIYKFRTMYLDAESDGPQLSKAGDTRITPIGNWLRKYRIDETPQFWNVFRGDMSIVGPRPERGYYIRQLVEKAPHYYLLHNVRPGITSWGMVRYGYASTLEEMLERFEYDWLYYENMSLFLDAAVLLYTLKTIIKGSGK